MFKDFFNLSAVMNSKASMWSLLIVALLALGVLATIGLDSSTGAVPSRPNIGGAIKPPVKIVDRGPESVTVVQDGYDEVYVDSSYADSLYVVCDLARALDVMEKMSPRSQTVCTNLLWPYIH